MRVRNSHLAAWCAPCLPVAALGLPLVVYLPPYYAGTLGLPLATVGFMFALVRLVDIPIDPFLGALMDNTRSRFGQFRPWMVGGAFLLAAGTGLLFFAEPGVSATRLFLSLFLLYLGFSGILLAQTAWGSRLSADYAERARIFGWWNAANILGALMLLVTPPIVDALAPGADTTVGIHAMGWLVLALIPLTVGLAGIFVPEGEAPSGSHRVRLADVKAVLADGRMRQLLAIDLLMSLVPGITGALFVFFFTRARGLPESVTSVLLLAYFVTGLLAAPLWIRTAKAIGKHRAAAVAVALLGLSLLAVVLLPVSDPAFAFGAMALAGLPIAAPPFLLRAMLADLNDAQTLDRQEAGEAGADTTGLNFAILTATQKLGYAIPVGLTYPILALIGFDPTPGFTNTPEALRALELLFVVPALLLGLAAAGLAWRWPITAGRHAEIRARLEPT